MDENVKFRVIVERVRSYSYIALLPACNKIAETSVKFQRLDCPQSFNSEHRSNLSSDYSSGER